MATDLKYYELELRLSTLERDDLITGHIQIPCRTLHRIALLYHLQHTPYPGSPCSVRFDRPLEWLENVSPGRPAPYLNPDCRIREFRTLNRAALEMHERAEKSIP